MRLQYETDRDLEHEESAKRLLERAWNCTLAKLPVSYHLDFGAFRNGKAVAWVEYKRRNIQYEAYDSIILSGLKWSRGWLLSQSTKLPFLFVVEWDDAIGYYEVKGDVPDLRIAGRGGLNYRDSADQEPCVHIPRSEFRIVQTEPVRQPA